MEDDFVDGLSAEDETVVPMASDFSSMGISPATIAKAEYIRTNLRMIRILTGDNGDPMFQARMANRTWRIFSQRFTGAKVSEPEKKLICEYMSGGQLNLLRWYASHTDEMSVYEMAMLLEKLTARVLSAVK